MSRAAGSVVHLEVQAVERPHAALIEKADRCLDNVAVVDHLRSR